MATQIELLISYCQQFLGTFHFLLDLIHVYLSFLSGFLIIFNPKLHFPLLIQLSNGHKGLGWIDIGEKGLSHYSFLIKNLVPNTLYNISRYFIDMINPFLILLNQMFLIIKPTQILLSLNDI